MDLADLLHLARNADPAVLQMSRAHCHAANVSSVVLARDDDGRLTRAFLAWLGHPLADNDSPEGLFSVGVHSHRYALALEGIHGAPMNRVYRYHFGGMRGRGDVCLPHYRFFPDVAGGRPTVQQCGSEYLELAAQDVVEPCMVTVLDHAELHTIWLPADETAAWLVREGRQRVQTTDLFTAREITTAGLYQPFDSAAAVVAHVEQFARIAS